MIYCLTGKILKKTLDTVVISCAGVGYAAQVPTTTAEALPAAGHEATLYTVLSVSENDVAPYGFASEDQRARFTPEKVALAASSGDHKAFTAASGVGPKLAQRIALELKDKVGKGLAAGTGFAAAGTAALPPASAPAQAVAALVSLGYTASEASMAVARVDDTLPVQDIIKIALRGLSRAGR